MPVKSFHIGEFDITYFEELSEYGENLIKDLALRISTHYEIKYDTTAELLTALISYVTKFKVVFVVTVEVRDNIIYLIERWRIGRADANKHPIIEMEIATNTEEVSAEYLESKMTRFTIPKNHKSILRRIEGGVALYVIDKCQCSYLRFRNKGFHLRRIISFHANPMIDIPEAPFWLRSSKYKFKNIEYIDIVDHFYKLEVTPIVNTAFKSLYKWMMNNLASNSVFNVLPCDPNRVGIYLEEEPIPGKSILKE